MKEQKDAFELAVEMNPGSLYRIIKKQKRAQTEDERIHMLESSTVQSPRKKKEKVKVSVAATIA